MVEWQTRRLQVPMIAISCRFKSCYPHQPSALRRIEVWLSLVERCVRDAEAVGSSPATSTIFYRAEFLLCFFVAVSRLFHSSPPLLKILRIYDMIPKDIIWKGISHL